MTGDVFKEDPARCDLADDPGDIGPEVALVIAAKPRSGGAERLAGVSGKHRVDSPSERPSVESGDIIPDWGRGEISGLLGGEDGGSGVSIPFDKGAGMKAGFGQHEAHIKATGSGA